jgi:hypothetical protein
MSIAGELHVFFGNGLRRSPYLHVRAVAFIDSVDRIASATSAPAPAAWAPATPAATRSLIMIMTMLALSHDFLCLSLVALNFHASKVSNSGPLVHALTQPAGAPIYRAERSSRRENRLKECSIQLARLLV